MQILVSRPHMVRACLAFALSLLGLFMASGASPLSSSAASNVAPLLPADDRVFDGAAFILTWDAKGSGSGQRPYYLSSDEFSQFSFGFQGEALIRYRWDPVAKYLKRSTLFTKAIITRDWNTLNYPDCYKDGGTPDIVTGVQHVMDPAAATGTFLPALGLDPPQQRPDGSWYIQDPFSGNEFWAATNYLETIVEDVETRQNRCWDGNKYENRDTFMHTWDSELLSPGDLEGDSLASTFSRSTAVESEFDTYPMVVQWSVAARRIGDCVGVTPPIEASSTVIKNLVVEVKPNPVQIPPNQGDTLTPPDPSTLIIQVTCDGVPVKNSELRVAVDAEPNSGGHEHISGGKPRPRGYLKRATDSTYTKITKQNPSITVKTDDKGEARVHFLPGRDLLTGWGGNCNGDQRGIAGTYDVTVTPTDTRFSDREATTAVEVIRTDFVPFTPNDRFISLYESAKHPDGTSGTAATLAGLQGVANLFYDIQLMHNKALTETGHAAWPIVPAAIIDVSLRDGGLFDTGGENVCLPGQPRSPFVPWRIPHQTHLKGKAIDFKTGHWEANSAYKNYYKRWRQMLHEAGGSFGSWANERTSFHLDVNQSAPAGNMSGGGYSGLSAPSALPNLYADVLADDPDEPLGAAPGQTVTYTLGLSNLSGGADAHNVILTGTLPVGLGFVSANPPPSRNSGGIVAWDLGTLAAGAFAQTFDLAAQVGGGVAVGAVLTMTAQASTSDAEATLEDNFAEAFPLYVQSPGPDLTVQSDIEAVAMTVGGAVAFHLQVENAGNAVAPSAALSLTLPTSVTLSSATPLTPTIAANTLVWVLGSLAPNESRAITVAVELDPRLGGTVTLAPAVQAAGQLTFTFSTGSAVADIEPDNNADEVVKPVELAGPDAAIWLAVDGGSFAALSAGQDLTLTLFYGNFGNQVAATSTLTLSLGTGLYLLSALPPPGRSVTSTVFGGGVSGWPLGNLAVGETGSIVVRVHVSSVPQAGSLVMAVIAPANRDIVPLNNAAILWGSAATTRRLFLPLIRR